MDCCHSQTSDSSQRNRPSRNWRSIASCGGSGVMLVLLPKCPMCIAAYLAMWTGLGLANSIASHLRLLFASLLFISLVFMLVHHLRNARS